MPESGSIQRSGLSPERLRRLHRALQGYVQRCEIAGIVALIHRHGQEAHVETLGWQDRETQIPIQRDTLFRIMSMTKPITAVAALMLVEEGKIRLYDPVDAWLPELANRMVLRDPNGSPDEVYPASRSITLHDLLTYRFGIGWTRSSLTPRIFALLPAQIADAMQIQDAEHLTPDAWMARLGEITLLYEPGERWLYHVAADILGVLIARIAEQPLETFLQERIFTPLGMVDTSFVVPSEKRDRLAVAYAKAATGELTVWDHPRNTRWAERGFLFLAWSIWNDMDRRPSGAVDGNSPVSGRRHKSALHTDRRRFFDADLSGDRGLKLTEDLGWSPCQAKCVSGTL